ncbi:hypothetical protein SBADM41S_03828 [Streptomyces badius]
MRWSTPRGSPKGTPWHPHRGFETVTYLIDGTFVHQDSNGGGGTIENGDTQWMTAGSGLLHIEAPPESLVQSGGLFHGLQLWVNLPKAHKMMDPRYQDIRGGEVQLLASPDGGALLRVIAGELDGHQGPGITHTPMTMIHATVRPGAEGDPAVARGLQRPGVRPGRARHGRRGTPSDRDGRDRRVRQRRLADRPRGRAAGRPHPGPGGRSSSAAARSGSRMARYGPFVMNSQAELKQAFEDFQGGRLGTVPAVHGM